MGMTEQEAIEELKNYRACSGTQFPEEMEVAIKALEKQIAKKPTLSGDGYWNGQIVLDTWECPSCGKDYEVEYEEHDYCPNCGQKIDWESIRGNEDAE